jgi:hypothetical protein
MGETCSTPWEGKKWIYNSVRFSEISVTLGCETLRSCSGQEAAASTSERSHRLPASSKSEDFLD